MSNQRERGQSDFVIPSEPKILRLVFIVLQKKEDINNLPKQSLNFSHFDNVCFCAVKVIDGPSRVPEWVGHSAKWAEAGQWEMNK